MFKKTGKPHNVNMEIYILLSSLKYNLFVLSCPLYLILIVKYARICQMLVISICAILKYASLTQKTYEKYYFFVFTYTAML